MSTRQELADRLFPYFLKCCLMFSNVWNFKLLKGPIKMCQRPTDGSSPHCLGTTLPVQSSRWQTRARGGQNLLKNNRQDDDEEEEEERADQSQYRAPY